MNTKTSFKKKLPAFAGGRDGEKAESLTSTAWGNALRKNKVVIKVREEV